MTSCRKGSYASVSRVTTRGFRSPDESEQQDQEVDADEDSDVDIDGRDEGTLSFESSASTDDLVDQLQDIKAEGE